MNTIAALESLPLSLKIGAYDWSIAVEYGAAESDDCGETDFEHLTIKLWQVNLKNPSHVVGVLLHECFHVVFENEKLHKLKKDKTNREEQIVTGYEQGVVSLLRDNPKLLMWIKKCLK